MAYASRSGRARTSLSNPQAHAICDRCGFRYNHVDLAWQMDWAGPGVINKRLLVCPRCNDVPQEQLRSIVLPADPTPILNPRPQDFELASVDRRVTSGQDTTNFWTGLPVPGGDVRVTQNSNTRVTQETGAATGSHNPLPGTVNPNDTDGLEIGLPYGMDRIPNAGWPISQYWLDELLWDDSSRWSD